MQKCDLTGKKILFILPPRRFRDEEYQLPRAVFEELGARVTVASSSVTPAEGMLGTVVTPGASIGDVDASEFDAVMLVGGTGANAYWHNGPVHRLVQKSNALGKVVSAICLAPVTLANAGLLKGRRATAYPSASGYLEWRGAHFTGSPVEVDGIIITARGPEAARDFAQAISRTLSAASTTERSKQRIMKNLSDLSREELLLLLDVYAKNWLAHDGSWFLAAEETYGMEGALDLDTKSWDRFAAAEAKRIMRAFGIPPNGGLQALATALQYRLYAAINKQEIEWVDDKTLVFRMKTCRVQETRRQKNLPDFPCKSVGLVEFSRFAGAVDQRIKTRCVACPPDPMTEFACAWEFTIEE